MIPVHPMIITRFAAAGYAMCAANVLRPMKGRDDPSDCHQKDNNREPYDRSKIEAGVLRACHKRPVSANEITGLIDEVETDIFPGKKRRSQAA